MPVARGTTTTSQAPEAQDSLRSAPVPDGSAAQDANKPVKVSRPQSVLDALADAATWRSAFRGVIGGDVVEASLLGSIAVRKMRGEPGVISNTDAGSTARDAARAAFRACPGLRG